jgi:hypothetical protein
MTIREFVKLLEEFESKGAVDVSILVKSEGRAFLHVVNREEVELRGRTVLLPGVYDFSIK